MPEPKKIDFFAVGLSDAIGFLGGSLGGYWIGKLLGMDIFAPGYGVASTVAILLVGLGVRELSVDVPSIPSIKARVRQYTLSACQALAKEVLNLPSAQAVTLRLQQFQSEN